MGGFKLHELLPKLKVRVTALHQHGDRLFVGCANGAIRVFSFELPNESTSSPVPILKHIKTHTLGKRPIDQIGVLPESSQLIVLSDTVVSLYTLPDVGKPTLLSAARNAHAFAVASFQYEAPRSKKAKSDAESNVAGTEQKRDLVVVGCRKKVVVYGAGKALTDPWELTLPHSPRAVIFPSPPSPTSPLPSLVHLLYSPTSSVILHLNPTSSQRLSVTELVNTSVPPISGRQADVPQPVVGGSGDNAGSSGLGMGMGAFSGLGGYVGLGSRAAVPVGTWTVGGEVIIAREDIGVFYSAEGNFTRGESIQWPSPPEALVSTNSFLYAIVPVLPAAGGTGSTSVPTLQIHLTPTLAPRESLSLPGPAVGALTVSSLTGLSLPDATRSAVTSSAARVLLVSTPTDKTLSASEGSTVWAVQAGDVGEQIDELVRDGRLVDAIGLAESVGDTSLSPKRRLPHLKTLLAVQDFAKGHFQAAIETFLVFNVNPALVISLYPSNSISGKLHAPRDKWMELFGAVEGARLEADDVTGSGLEQSGRSLLRKVAGLGVGVGVGKKASVDTLRNTSDPETASIASNEKVLPAAAVIDETVIPRPALEALMYFLSDRRQKLTGAISSALAPLPAEESLPPLSTLPAETLHQLPSVPMSEYQPEELLRVAQVIYTALIKVYLVARPVLVGSLCRIENWCDVEEVEELLKEKKKFSDLIDLYQGKKMHGKALAMLHDLAKEEDDKLDRYPPTVRYLQKLGPDYLDLILDNSKWVLAEDSMIGLQIFTADEPEVEGLPSSRIVAFLEKQSTPAYLGYLEHLIVERKSEESDNHDRLAEVYLERAKVALKGSKVDERPSEYTRFLDFLTTSTHYRPHRLLGKLKGDQMPEAKAILLGRLGKHEEALRIYVFTLKDYTAAETYCSRAYVRDPNPKGIFLLLLRIYLHPPTKSEPVLLEPALSLISTHGTRLDAGEVLDLLPPLVTMEDVRAFFVKTIRGATAKKNDSRIVRGLVASRKEEVERTLMGQQVKRVRITDQRICPQCQKRLGTSAIAVHSPRGEVTHLHCKDTFSSHLQQIRE